MSKTWAHLSPIVSLISIAYTICWLPWKIAKALPALRLLGDLGYALNLIKYALKYFNHIANPIICITASEKFRFEARYIIFCGNVEEPEVVKDGDVAAYRESKRYSVANPNLRPTGGSVRPSVYNAAARASIAQTGVRGSANQSSYQASPLQSPPSYQSNQSSTDSNSRLLPQNRHMNTIATSKPSEQFNYKKNVEERQAKEKELAAKGIDLKHVMSRPGMVSSRPRISDTESTSESFGKRNSSKEYDESRLKLLEGKDESNVDEKK